MTEIKEKKMDQVVGVRLRPTTKEALDKACHQQDRSISYIIEKALREYLKLE